MQILGFEDIFINIWAWTGRGLAASSSTSNRVNPKLFKHQKQVELLAAMLYSTVASDGGYIAL